jgi:hypothetical protein
MTDFLESKIKPLVEALNTWPGIETFSSCHGHETEDWRSIPHVTFTCEDDTSLREICDRLRGTRWRVTLEDFSHGPELHHTLRFVPRRLTENPSLLEIQAAIASLADMLSKDTLFRPCGLENNFPVLACPKCQGNAFSIQTRIDFALSYIEGLHPSLGVEEIGSARIMCRQCFEEISTGREAAAEVRLILDRADREGTLFA